MTAHKKHIPALRFKEFEGDWKKITLGEIGQIIRGASPRPQGDPRYYGGNIPRLMVKDVTRDGKYVTPRIDFLTEEGAKRSRPCKKGTLTIVCSGTVGIPSILAVDACIHDGFLALLNVDKKVSIDFLYQILSTLQQTFDKSATHGGVFTNLTTTLLSDFRLTIPSFGEQVKIASFLDLIDEKIQQLTHKKALLEQYKKGVMQQLFSGKLRFKDENGKAYPKWEESGLGKHIDLISGFAFKGTDISEKVGGVPLMRGINITEGVIRHGDDIDRFFHGDASSLDDLRLRQGDLVIGMDGSKVGKNSALVTKLDEDSLLVQRVARIRSLDTADIRFIYQHIRSTRFHQYVDTVNTSSGIPHISSKQIKDFKISFPIKEEQEKIASFLSAIDTKIETVATQIAKTQEFKKGLLQKMFV